jgi:hypothetical protein
MSYSYISVALVRERTIPTERPPLVGEVSFTTVMCLLMVLEMFPALKLYPFSISKFPCFEFISTSCYMRVLIFFSVSRPNF